VSADEPAPTPVQKLTTAIADLLGPTAAVLYSGKNLGEIIIMVDDLPVSVIVCGKVGEAT